jgi:hypothetical protein
MVALPPVAPDLQKPNLTSLPRRKTLRSGLQIIPKISNLSRLLIQSWTRSTIHSIVGYNRSNASRMADSHHFSSIPSCPLSGLAHSQTNQFILCCRHRADPRPLVSLWQTSGPLGEAHTLQDRLHACIKTSFCTHASHVRYCVMIHDPRISLTPQSTAETPLYRG